MVTIEFVWQTELAAQPPSPTEPASYGHWDASSCSDILFKARIIQYDKVKHGWANMSNKRKRKYCRWRNKCCKHKTGSEEVNNFTVQCSLRCFQSNLRDASSARKTMVLAGDVSTVNTTQEIMPFYSGKTQDCLPEKKNAIAINLLYAARSEMLKMFPQLVLLWAPCALLMLHHWSCGCTVHWYADISKSMLSCW